MCAARIFTGVWCFFSDFRMIYKKRFTTSRTIWILGVRERHSNPHTLLPGAEGAAELGFARLDWAACRSPECAPTFRRETMADDAASLTCAF